MCFSNFKLMREKSVEKRENYGEEGKKKLKESLYNSKLKAKLGRREKRPPVFTKFRGRGKRVYMREGERAMKRDDKSVKTKLRK